LIWQELLGSESSLQQIDKEKPMPRGSQGLPAERVDVVDYTRVARTFTKESVAQNTELIVLDNQARVRRGFRVELPDQSSYPGRIVVHGGDAYDPDGVRLFNEDQDKISRSITLEGATTDFYVEIQFTEGDGDVDGRAFWDPTVDQGTDTSGDDLPDGQEFSDNVATTKVPDWKIVTPISTTAFARDSDPDSTKIPLIQLTTDGSNEINSTGTVGLATDKPATTILEVISTTVLRVQDAQMFPNGSDITVGVGATGEETAVITTAVASTGLVTLSGALSNSHSPGEIMKGRLSSSLDLIDIDEYGRYARGEFANPIDYRDRLFQGDEVHGDILSEGHDTTPDDQSSDVNLQAMKDHIDFLSAQIQEMRWGHRNPYVDDDDATRAPPGVVNDIPTTPRYFHKSGGSQGARTATVTVGDGTASWGDFVGADETGIQAAIDALPAGGGRVVIKGGNYSLDNDVVLTTDNVHIIGLPNTALRCNGGELDVQVTGRVALEGLSFVRLSTTVGVNFNTSAPSRVEIKNCDFTDTTIDVAVALPDDTFVQECEFATSTQNISHVQTTAAGGVIKGVWEKCTFTNGNGTGKAGSCIDASGATTGLVNASFVDCIFSSTLANTATIDCGSAPDVVSFTRCKFTATITLTAGHIWFDGGTTLAVTGCINNDLVSRLVDANLSSEVIVDGILQLGGAGSQWPILRAIDCDNVTVRNCRIQMFGTVALTQNALRFESKTQDVRGIIISENTIEGLNNHCTGIIFDCSAGTGDFYDIQIIDNNFKELEAGIFFKSGIGTRQYYGVTVKGNHFNDRGSSESVASYQKLAITAGVNAQMYQTSIVNNKFINLNPATTDTISGRTRVAIDLQGSCIRCVISDNIIRNVGDISNPLATTRGIYVGNMFQGSVCRNQIQQTNGIDAAAIAISETSSSGGLTVSENNIIQVQSTTGAVAGILIKSSLENSSISGNTVDAMTTTSGVGACIYSPTVATTNLDRLSIVGNVGEDNGDFDFINLGGQAVRHCTIKGNVGRDCDRGIVLIGNASSIISQCSISDNSIESRDRCIDINVGNGATTANCRRISITGNVLLCDTADSRNIDLGRSTMVTCNSNTMENSGTTHTTRGHNIYVDEVIVFTIMGNVCRIQDEALTSNIELSATCDLMAIFGNLLDKGTAGTLGNCILGNVGAAGTAEGNMIAGNVADTAASAIPANVDGVAINVASNYIIGTGTGTPY
jgi:hypothetical protein